MTDEIKERPDRATGPREVWECDNGLMFIAHDSTGGLRLKWKESGGIYCDCSSEVCPPGRYRIRTIPDEPWPPKTRKEKRRVVQFRYSHDDPDDSARVYYYSVRAKITPCKTVQIICDEIRDCKIGENGKVVEVIPFEEEE